MTLRLTKKDLFWPLRASLISTVAIATNAAIPLIRGVPYDRIIEPSYANGLITASGVLLGFIFTTTITGHKELDRIRVLVLTGYPMVFFFFSLCFIFNSQITGGLRVLDLVILQSNLFFDFVWWLYVLIVYLYPSAFHA